MNQSRRALAAVIVALVGVVFWSSFPAAADVPDRLTDQEFWEFSERMSEPNGFFRNSDNFLSNERGYQVAIPELLRLAKPGRVYLGVGPEQNFPYIIALKPKMVIIFDIRRGNLHEHLLYKALFEMSTDRADFLSKLWSRARPSSLTKNSSVAELMSAYQGVSPTAEAYDANLKAVMAWLTGKPQLTLRVDDPAGIEYVYRNAFYIGGPDLGSRGGRGGGSSYAALQMLDDGQGLNRGFLATEENWQVIKDLHSRNMIVPVVGDFGGPSAIRSVGAYLKKHGVVVSAFYLSNVEQYLNQDGKEDAFLCNVATLPLDETSTFIYTGVGRYGGGGRGGGGGLNTTFLRPMLPDTAGCAIR
jgi:hypothetical protein